MLKFLIATAAALLLLPGSSRAQDLPHYDVDGWCHAVASAGGLPSEMIRRGCLQQEQGAYDGLKGRWSALPRNVRSWCDGVARSGGEGSYTLLSGCVQQEMNAAQQNQQFRFRR